MIQTHLAQSPVVFREDTHQYFHGEKELQGITAMLRRQLFPGKYAAGIPQAVLDAAAERGHAVHALCQFEDEAGLPAAHDDPELTRAATQYTLLRRKAACRPLASEYTVSDLTRFASRIDCVWQDDEGGGIILADIKTTYELDRDWLSWQLSVYAYLFERQNLGTDVSRLLGVWLPFRGGRFASELAAVVPVRRVPDEEISRLLRAEAAGEQYTPPAEYAPVTALPTAAAADALPDITRDYIDRYLLAVRQMRESREVKEQVEEALLLAMERHGVKTFDNGTDFRATYTAASEGVTFDEAAFKEDHPDMWQRYRTKPTSRKASVRVTAR